MKKIRIMKNQNDLKYDLKQKNNLNKENRYGCKENGSSKGRIETKNTQK